MYPKSGSRGELQCGDRPLCDLTEFLDKVIVQKDSHALRACEGRSTARVIIGRLIPSGCGAYKTVKARFCPWLSGKSPSKLLGCSLFRKRPTESKPLNKREISLLTTYWCPKSGAWGKPQRVDLLLGRVWRGGQEAFPQGAHNSYRGTSLIRKRTSLGPYRRPLPRVLGGFQAGGCFLMGEVPL